MEKWPAHRFQEIVKANAVEIAPRVEAQLDIFGGGAAPSLEREMYPTPTATLYGYSSQSGGSKKTKRPSLEGWTGGPWIAFREWLMGWPIGWSDSRPLATDRFPQWLQSHGGFLRQG